VNHHFLQNYVCDMLKIVFLLAYLKTDLLELH